MKELRKIDVWPSVKLTGADNFAIGLTISFIIFVPAILVEKILERNGEMLHGMDMLFVFLIPLLYGIQRGIYEPYSYYTSTTYLQNS